MAEPLFLVHAPFDSGSIEQGMGRSDYSYYFVLRAYRPVLERLGEVREISDPAAEVDRIHAQCEAARRPCVFLCFAPPHDVPTGLRCPTIPVFAWEYDTLPDESWRGEDPTDWVALLGRLGRAITHSGFAVDVVRRELRADYPVVSVPAPVWDRFNAAVPAAARGRPAGAAHRLLVDGTVLDGRAMDLAGDAAALLDANPPASQALVLDGVVFTSVFCPLDGRKNWEDAVSAFCWAFAGETAATLVLKLVHHDREEALTAVLDVLRRLPPCAARIVVLHAYLDDTQYVALVAATDYVVNSSLGEGQCLPLMEYMSAGVPAIAPAHSAMRDYVDPGCAFVVPSFREWTNWPHDMRLVLRTHRERPEWGALRDAFVAALRLRIDDPPGYMRLSVNARARLREHCSARVAAARLRPFFAAIARDQAAARPGRRHPVARIAARLRGLFHP